MSYMCSQVLQAIQEISPHPEHLWSDPYRNPPEAGTYWGNFGLKVRDYGPDKKARYSVEVWFNGLHLAEFSGNSPRETIERARREAARILRERAKEIDP